jgi:hypothetical protein
MRALVIAVSCEKALMRYRRVEFAIRPKFQEMPLVYDFNTSWLSIGIGARTITAGHQNGSQSAFSLGEACSDLGVECHSTGTAMSLHTAIFYGSVRGARAGIRVVRYLTAALRRRGHTTAVIDAAEERFPLLDRMYKEYERGSAPIVLEALAELYRRVDAFVIVSGEYNHGIPPALKNLLDHFLEAQRTGAENWRLWGPYLAEHAWGTVREDYSPYGEAFGKSRAWSAEQAPVGSVASAFPRSGTVRR